MADISLATIKKPKSHKKRKTIGRGNASGHGTYSGKGMKGQRSRSGVSRLKLKKIGMKRGRSALRGVPKLRGFKSKKPKNQIVKITDINKLFKVGEIVNPKNLLAKGLIAKGELPIKILGNEELTIKNLKFEGVSTTKNIQAQLTK